MALDESIVEDAALEWSGEQTRVARTLIPAFSWGPLRVITGTPPGNSHLPLRVITRTPPGDDRDPSG